jgi:MFS family permease
MAVGAVLAFAVVPGSGGEVLPLVVRYLGVLLFSMVGGMVPGTLFALAAVLAPDKRCISTTVGWMQQLSACGQFVGPPLVGWVASLAGDWRWTWVVTGSCALVGMLVALQIAREVRR